MNEKLYKASDVVGIMEDELSDGDFYKVLKRLAETPMGIVCCKDCRHFEPFTNGERNGYHGLCRYGYSDVNETYMSFFCAYGERSE